MSEPQVYAQTIADLLLGADGDTAVTALQIALLLVKHRDNARWNERMKRRETADFPASAPIAAADETKGISCMECTHDRPQHAFTRGKWVVLDIPAARALFGGPVICTDVIEDAVIAVVGEDIVESAANARLLAAAPEMYRALHEMLNDEAFAELCSSIGSEPEWMGKAKAVLAEARGEA